MFMFDLKQSLVIKIFKSSNKINEFVNYDEKLVNEIKQNKKKTTKLTKSQLMEQKSLKMGLVMGLILMNLIFQQNL